MLERVDQVSKDESLWAVHQRDLGPEPKQEVHSRWRNARTSGGGPPQPPAPGGAAAVAGGGGACDDPPAEHQRFSETASRGSSLGGPTPPPPHHITPRASRASIGAPRASIGGPRVSSEPHPLWGRGHFQYQPQPPPPPAAAAAGEGAAPGWRRAQRRELVRASGAQAAGLYAESLGRHASSSSQQGLLSGGGPELYESHSREDDEEQVEVARTISHHLKSSTSYHRGDADRSRHSSKGEVVMSAPAAAGTLLPSAAGEDSGFAVSGVTKLTRCVGQACTMAPLS